MIAINGTHHRCAFAARRGSGARIRYAAMPPPAVYESGGSVLDSLQLSLLAVRSCGPHLGGRGWLESGGQRIQSIVVAHDQAR
eukprot:COSAG02_NODE_1099_length_14585_cov_19.264669_7_plen_83_part_00